MAFDKTRFNQVARAGDWALWVLQTADAAAVADAAGYIAPAKSYNGLLKPGHIVLRITYTDTTYAVPASWGLHMVNAVSATAIDISDELAGVVTDTRMVEAMAGIEPPPSPRRPDETEAAYKTRLEHEHKAWLDQQEEARTTEPGIATADRPLVPPLGGRHDKPPPGTRQTR